MNLPLPEPHAPYAHDVASNEAADNSRLFFLILDDVHTLRERTDSVKAVAKRFVERLSPGDRLAVAWASMGKAGAREFTTNHAEVLAAIDRFSATDTRVARRNPRDVALPDFSDLDDIPSSDARDLATKNIKADFDRSRPFQMVTDVCSYLASLAHRRKAVVFIGTGPGGMELKEEIGKPPSRDILDFVRAMNAARRANVAVYLVDPGTVLRAKAVAAPSLDVPADPAWLLGKRGEVAPIATAGGGQGMAMLSLATGGTENRGPAALDAIDRVVSDTGTYYLVGYYADPPRGRTVDKMKRLFDPSSGFRSIEVRTTRPGVAIRARRGYWASEAGGAAAEKSVPKKPGDGAGISVADVLPQSALALRAFAAPLRGKTSSKPEVAVVVEATLPSLAPATLGLSLTDDIEMLVAAVAPGQGVRATDRAKVRLNVSNQTRERFVSPRYRLCSVIAVEPGHYQIRVGVRSSLAGKTGSVYTDVTVPDFARAPVSLGGLFLERPAPHAPLPTVRTKTFAALVPFAPALDREFVSGDTVWARVRAYAGKGAAGPVLLRASVSRQQDRVEVWTADEPKSADALRHQDGAEYAVQLPLSILAPGTYRLRLTVAGQAANLATREIDFSVRTVAPTKSSRRQSTSASSPPPGRPRRDNRRH